MIYTTHYNSPVGMLLLAEKDDRLAGLWIEGQKYFLGELSKEEAKEADTPALRESKYWLDRYFSGEKPSAKELDLAPAGSEFRKEVWKILCEIPYGEVMTYGAISRKIAENHGLKTMIIALHASFPG